MQKPIELLLVEDNEGDVEMTLRALRDVKPICNLSVANDGLEALDFLRREGKFAVAPTPHLILLDLNMPKMDGKRLLEEVKRDPELKHIPVIMLTSSQSPSDIRDCYDRQASCYIVKPFDGREFAEAVREVIRFWSGLGKLPGF